ncbi:hypothetical protein [Natronomonas sp.]|uniref:DUF7857 domain-containing protein n=1 Tax=Natronomonas sp. TaxID=2184060 RepID=UPI002625CE28|nr:hypothetical protein [Natronomonas sp.]
MPNLSIETVRSDPVTFVEAVLESDRPCSVRLETDVDGTVWPPRVDGTVVGEWDDGSVTLEAAAGSTPIGFATPAVVDRAPIRIVHSERRPTDRPSAVEAWLGRMERRLETAETLADAEDLTAAADAVAAVGGLSAVETLAGEIDRDRRIAARLSTVPDGLCERLDAVDVPTSAFVTLAEDGAEGDRS